MAGVVGVGVGEERSGASSSPELSSEISNTLLDASLYTFVSAWPHFCKYISRKMFLIGGLLSYLMPPKVRTASDTRTSESIR